VRARTAEAPAEAKPSNRRAFLARLACGALAVAMVVALYGLLTAPVFKVARVEATGQNLLTYSEVVQASGVLGANVFTLDRRRVAEAVLGLGTLRSAEVAVALPNVVRIAVVEYEPRYVWLAGAESYLVDERGVVLGAARGQPTLPAVREPDGAARKRGDRVTLSALQAAARLATAWPSRLGEAPACEYGPNGLVLASKAWRAELGDGANLEAQVLALGAVLDEVKSADKEFSFVDLRSAERPYYK
jgi:cell division septal protein FtsQ